MPLAGVAHHQSDHDDVVDRADDGDDLGDQIDRAGHPIPAMAMASFARRGNSGFRRSQRTVVTQAGMKAASSATRRWRVVYLPMSAAAACRSLIPHRARAMIESVSRRTGMEGAW
jgi:hypothetical protein